MKKKLSPKGKAKMRESRAANKVWAKSGRKVKGPKAK